MHIFGFQHAQSYLILCNPWTIAWQAPLSIDTDRQEYWSGWPFPPPGDLTNPEIKLTFSALQADSLQLTTWEHHIFGESPKFPEVYFLIQDKNAYYQTCWCILKELEMKILFQSSSNNTLLLDDISFKFEPGYRITDMINNLPNCAFH